MKFISAGHCNKQGSNFDSGAVGVNGRLEANETVKIRNRVLEILKQKNISDFVTDMDGESLKEYLNRIKTGNGSVVVEFHFDAFNGKASGTTGLVSANPSANSIAFAKELASETSRILSVPLRDGGDGDGFMTEADSHRGRLGLMRESGIVCLLEVCFIDNASDMQKFDANFEALCQSYATIIQKYDDLIK